MSHQHVVNALLSDRDGHIVGNSHTFPRGKLLEAYTTVFSKGFMPLVQRTTERGLNNAIVMTR